MLLFDFTHEDAIGAWVSVNDVVMGGVSNGRLEATGNGTVAFTGFVSLEQGGGFASVRSRPQEHDLGGKSGLQLRVRGDGQRYKVNLKNRPPDKRCPLYGDRRNPIGRVANAAPVIRRFQADPSGPLSSRGGAARPFACDLARPDDLGPAGRPVSP